jgi:integrase
MARLFARLDKERDYSWEPVQIDRKGRFVEIAGATSFFVRYTDAKGKRRVSRSVKALADAKLLLAQCEVEEHGGTIVKPILTSPSGRIRLIDAAEKYKAELKIVDRSKSTVLVYVNAIDGFVASCKKEFLDEIVREDILEYITWMRQNLKTRIAGGQNRTIRNRLTYLGTFLSKCPYPIKLKKERNTDANSPGLLFPSDTPKVMKKKPKKYDRDTIDKLLTATGKDEDAQDYIQFLLWSGFRDEEVQYLQYTDFHWRNSTVTVHAKPHLGWKPKDWEERTVTLPRPVCDRMKARMDRPRQYVDAVRKPADADLVFPNGAGRPDSHLIYRLHAVAKAAKLDLKGQRAGHMFRKTAGSRVAKKLGIRAAMDFLGHSDIKTTALYLASDELDPQKTRAVVDQMWKDGD